MKNAQVFSKIDVVLATNCKSGLQWEWAFQRDLRRFIKITGRDSSDDRYADILIRINASHVIKADQPEAIDAGSIRSGYGLCFYHFLAK